MRGSSPAAAITRYVASLQRSLDCVTNVIAIPQGYHPAGEPHALVVNQAQSFDLSGGNPAVSLVMQQQYAFSEDRSVSAAQRWRVRATSYWYYLLDRETQAELFAFHWHPGIAEQRRATTVPTPHMHVGSDLLAASAMPFVGTHIPSGLVLVEDVLRFVITELVVKPRRLDWEDVLGRAETRGAFPPP